MRKVTNQTLTHLIEAMDDGRAVTIRYVKANGEVSRRKIEIHAIEVTAAGQFVLRVYDHRSADQHTFRLDRVTHYTLHRQFGHTVPTVPAQAEIVTADAMTGDEDVTGYRAWDFKYKLAA